MQKVVQALAYICHLSADRWTVSGFWLLSALLLAALNSSGAQIFLSYFKVGGTLVLSPAWAYGKNSFTGKTHYLKQ